MSWVGSGRNKQFLIAIKYKGAAKAVPFLSKGILKMAVKVDGKKLHLTTFNVLTTGRNMKACLIQQKKMAELDQALKHVKDDDDQSVINFLDKQVEWIDEIDEFLKTVLQLSDSQLKKIEDADFYDAVDFANEVVAKVLRMDTTKSEDK